ncbi:Thiol-disulfide isomerase or thioredoxin [Lutibacter oricola]|uniref:Thiol-disulfide isomerase or thioredoxin n=1 Tax=Lutibacter oricola TaxID=762486 RepID=A0A1H2X8F1_9FLAO|nr:TlpA disulfide reductase family protein [Lutibacter oricola]SDW89130.1 Thiol-disulfide isomerase or thioredoxin [Lutibacter oricola]
MNSILKKKNISNFIFLIAVAVLLYPPSREWFMRQIAFSPSINNVEDSKKIDTYNWSLKGLNTDSVNFNEFENRVVFVNFWATWCPPCRAEMPMLQELYNDYKDKVKFVFVTSENLNEVNTYFKKENYKLPVYNSTSIPPKLFTETNSIPASYLIDKRGNIIIDKVGSANWNSDKVRTLLDDLLKN